MSRVQSLTYCTKIGGPGHGSPLFDLTLSADESGTEIGSMDLIHEITEASERLGDKARIVQFHANPALENEDEIRQLLTGIRENGFALIGNIVGSYVPSYKDVFTSIVASVFSTRWFNFRANEIHYYPENDLLQEPEISQPNHASFKYVMLKNKVPATAVFKFMRESQHLWGLVVPQARSYEVELFPGVN